MTHKHIKVVTLILAGVFFAPFTARAVPAPAEETAILELESVSIDDAPATDLSAYDGFDVSVEAASGLGASSTGAVGRGIGERVFNADKQKEDWIYYFDGAALSAAGGAEPSARALPAGRPERAVPPAALSVGADDAQ